MEPASTLRQWALIADSIASQQSTHYQRQQRIDILISMVADYTLSQPIWHKTLINLLHQTTNHRMNYSHTEVRGLLNLFRDICLHVADNQEAWWLAWAMVTADELNHELKKPKPDPFKNFFDAEEDEDDTQS